MQSVKALALFLIFGQLTGTAAFANEIPLRKVSKCSFLVRLTKLRKEFPYDFRASHLHFLGVGGSSMVMNASYKGTGRKTVRKYLSVDHLGASAFSEKDFVNEHQIYLHLIKNKFKHSAKYFGIWRDENNKVFMEFNFVPGKNYSNHLQTFFRSRNSPQSELKRSLKEFNKILSAFEELHTTNVMHFDIKGANIFISENGEISILDFNSAKIKKKDPDHTGSFYEKPSLYSIDYAAPENDKDSMAPVGPHSDVYSLGKMLELELLKTWEYTFSESMDPSQKNNLLKSFHDKIIAKATHPDHSKRFSSVRQLRMAIEDWLSRYS
jgi:serine/threonine protein kinase